MLIIDGNNLWYAAISQDEPLAGVSRTRLLGLLDYYARRSGEQVVVVLDGRRPRSAGGQTQVAGGCQRIYSGAKSADDVIIELVSESSEPRRLTLISSDRELVRQVRKRRVRAVDAERFAHRLEGWLNRPRPVRRDEPDSKWGGLGGSKNSIEEWLKFFDLHGPTSDIMGGERAGSQDGGQSRRIISSLAQASPSPVVVALTRTSDEDMRRAFPDVQPLKHRDRRRRKQRGRTGGGNGKR